MQVRNTGHSFQTALESKATTSNFTSLDIETLLVFTTATLQKRMAHLQSSQGPATTHGIRHVLQGTDTRLRSAYRQLFRAALQAVRFSTPARYQVRSILRESFRKSPPAAFNPRRIQHTIAFLEQAREHNGYEHKILRNILHVRYWKDNVRREKIPMMLKQNDKKGLELRETIPGHFAATLDMFNESMDLCLRV